MDMFSNVGTLSRKGLGMPERQDEKLLVVISDTIVLVLIANPGYLCQTLAKEYAVFEFGRKLFNRKANCIEERSHLFGLVRLGRGGVHAWSGTWSIMFFDAILAKRKRISSDHSNFSILGLVGPGWSLFISLCLVASSRAMQPSAFYESAEAPPKQVPTCLCGSWWRMLGRALDLWTLGSMWTRKRLNRIHGQKINQRMNGLPLPPADLKISRPTLDPIPEQSAAALPQPAASSAAPVTQAARNCWTMPMSHRLLGVFAGNRS